MPMTIWLRPRRMQKQRHEERDRHAAEPAGEEAEPEGAGVVGGDEAGIGADQHHAFDADVEDAGLLRDLLAEAGQQQRHAGGDGAEEQRRSRKASVSRASMAQAVRRLRRRWSRYSTSARKMSSSATSTSTKCCGTPTRRAALSPPIISTEKNKVKPIDGKAVEAGEEDERHDEQADRPDSSRPAPCPRRRGSRPRPPSPISPALRAKVGDGEPADIEPGMDRGARIGADHLQLQAEGGAGHHEMHEDDDRERDEHAADAPWCRRAAAAGPRPAGSRVCGTVVPGSRKKQLDQHIGEADAEEAHHQRGDDLVDAVARLQDRRHQRPEGADRHARRSGR